MARKPILAANWKMNLGRPEDALAFFRKIRHGLNSIDGVDLVLCPPSTVLFQFAELLAPTRIALGAQNSHWEDQGAETGEISPQMVVGFVSTSFWDILSAEPPAAAMSPIRPSIGSCWQPFHTGSLRFFAWEENLEQNRAGETDSFVSVQVKAAFRDVKPAQAASCVVAYEPIWAIGSGEAATPADANRVIGLSVRGALAEIYDEEVAQQVRVQYGGSVTPDNISEFMVMPEVDGALVGGASLKPQFVDLARRLAEG